MTLPSKLVQSLPSRSGPELLEMFWNSMCRLADNTRRAEHADTKYMVRLIEEQWRVRKLEPFLREETLTRPSTDATLGDKSLDLRSSPEEGVLLALGYHVGQTHPVSAAVRQQILRHIVEGELPPIRSHDYMRDWGAPGTADRLKKLAETLAALARNEEHKMQSSLRKAIAEREADLRFIYEEYYVGKFDFVWPATWP